MASAHRHAVKGVFLLSRSVQACQGINAAVCQTAWGGQLAAAAAATAGCHSCWSSTHGLLQTPCRYISTQTAAAQQVLDSVSATKLREDLQCEAEVRPFMSYQELLHFILSHNAASTESEATERAEALIKAGVVLRFNSVVYLRPEEVSEFIFKTLPADPQQAERNLADVEQQLVQMDKQHRQIFAQAQRWPRFWLYAGCAALATQLVAFTYLTWWELSWDVMEPVAYIVSLTYSVIAYIYFLYTRGSYFEQKDFKEYWEQQQLEKTMAKAGFDLDKYQHLMRTRERYKRYLASRDDIHMKQILQELGQQAEAEQELKN